MIIKNITEKPSFEFNVNAGIYVFNPKVLNKIKKNTYFDIPDLISQLIKKRKRKLLCFLYMKIGKIYKLLKIYLYEKNI